MIQAYFLKTYLVLAYVLELAPKYRKFITLCHVKEKREKIITSTQVVVQIHMYMDF